MSPPHSSSDYNSSLYNTPKDVLTRLAEIVEVQFLPNPDEKRKIRATVSPNRVTPPTGPDSPKIDVEWKIRVPHDQFHTDYADPNLEFHCGWHQDTYHPDLGTAHFQYEYPGMATPHHEAVTFEYKSPPRILWECIDQLFSHAIPTHTEALSENG